MRMGKRLEFNLSARASYLLAAFIICLSLSLLSAGFRKITFYPLADEGYYFKYAVYISEHGFSGFNALFNAYLANARDWVFPSPLRIAYISFSALWLKAFGAAFINLAYFSLFCFALFLMVNFYFSSRYMGYRLSLLLLILLSFSPLNLSMSRRCLAESCLLLFSSSALWLFLEALRKRSTGKLLAFAVIYSLSVLVKESAFLLLIFFAACHLWLRYFVKRAVPLKEIFWIYLAPCLILTALYLKLGVLAQILPMAKIILESPGLNPYAVIFGSGSWLRYIIDYLLLSPAVALLAIAFIIVSCVRDDLRREWVWFFLLYFGINFAIFNFFTKNLRYVMMLDLPLRIFALLMLEEITRRFFPQKQVLAMFILVAAIAASGYLRFNHFFVAQGIYDPVSFFLLKAERIIPYQ